MNRTTEKTEQAALLARSEIERQMERILQHEHFRHSKRFPGFIRYVVAAALDEKSEFLKERNIGVDVFGRPSNYDTADDPIVRVTAAEVRKRIAQYYDEPGHEDELRISIPSGRYAPSFDLPRATAKAPSAQPQLPAEPVSLSPVAKQPISALYWTAAVVAASLLIAFSIWISRSHADSLTLFWKPVVESSRPVLLCIADRAGSLNAENPPYSTPQLAVIDDLAPALAVSAQLRLPETSYKLRGASELSLRDLQDGPNIFIGAYDNPWAMRATSGLHFYFAYDATPLTSPDAALWIQDRSSITPSGWRMAAATSNTSHKDYGIAARFHDPNTGQISVIIAGLDRGGTVAAGKFVTSLAGMDQLAANAPENWSKKNIEVVVSAMVIGGHPTPPHLEAVYVW